MLKFYKYQGTGNDFIIIDNRNNEVSIGTEQVNRLCDRKFGIGADGLMLLNAAEEFDFEMKYYNSDGKEGSMCGNGGRCLVRFAYDMGIHKSLYHFTAIDGEHEAGISAEGLVSLKMKDVDSIRVNKGDFILDTGSPHYVKQVNELDTLDVFREGSEIRNNDEFIREGINVNFVELEDEDKLFVRTFERGVEDETLSCGTGVTAAALAFYHNENGFNNVIVKTRGGTLNVEYEREMDGHYKNIWLSGPAEKVFEGQIEIPG